MLRGFNIVGISEVSFNDVKYENPDKIHDVLHRIGKEVGEKYKSTIVSAIEAIERDGKIEISGNKVEGLCFPHLPFHVFISHSHKDERVAIELAGFLKDWCGIDAFVDSSAWNYRDEIIERIVKVAAGGRRLAADDYLNLYVSVASHVDCMLNKALISMIDECECLFFLNTPNSIPSTKLGSVTYSPWIYTELEASRVIRKRTSDRRPGLIKESFSADESPYLITYDVRLDHLTSVSPKDVISCGHEAYYQSKVGFAALDKLYNLFPIEKGVAQ